MRLGPMHSAVDDSKPLLQGWSNNALLRATQFLYNLQQVGSNWWATGDDEWMPWVINCAYSMHFPAALLAHPGKNMAWTDWMFAR